MSINIPNSTITKFNLCRLQKQMYFFTDTLDSKNINLHSLIAHPDYHRSNNEKFPMIQVPNSYWKIWSNILRTLQASVRVSGYYPGRCVGKKRVIWLQKYNRSQLMQKIEEGKYQAYFLQSTSRKLWKYHKHTFHETIYESMEDFHYVKIKDESTLLSTDGFDESIISSLSQARAKLPIHKRSQDFLRWIHAQITHTRKPKPKESWDVYISEQIKSKLPNEEIGDLLTAIETLHPTLQRNLGGIQDIQVLHAA